MALNSSGPISIAGTVTGQSIQVELLGNGTTQMSLNDTTVRTLAGVASGEIAMPTNFYGKSNKFIASITSSQADLNLRTWALANGWDGTVAVEITVNAGVYVYSTSTSNAGLTVTGSFPGGVTLINNGYIIGKGGKEVDKLKEELKKITKKEVQEDLSFLKNQRESKVTKKFSDIAKDEKKPSMKKIKLGLGAVLFSFACYASAETPSSVNQPSQQERDIYNLANRFAQAGSSNLAGDVVGGATSAVNSSAAGVTKSYLERYFPTVELQLDLFDYNN
jgi:hypothetical protein